MIPYEKPFKIKEDNSEVIASGTYVKPQLKKKDKEHIHEFFNHGTFKSCYCGIIIDNPKKPVKDKKKLLVPDEIEYTIMPGELVIQDKNLGNILNKEIYIVDKINEIINYLKQK